MNPTTKGLAMILNFATEVTDENVPSIIEWMRQFNLDVSFELDGIPGCYRLSEHEATYAYLSIRRDVGYEDIAKFSLFGETDFNRNWQFVDHLDTGLFKPVVDRESA